jgi:IS30 family transposase
MTNDNGHEFGEFWKLEEMIRAKVYFSPPLCPWERGTVENTIGLLRQYIPKGFEGYRTPNEFTSGKLQRLIKQKKIEVLPPEYYEQFYGLKKSDTY